MKRLMALPILLLTASCLASTPKEILTKRDKQFNDNILKGDGKAMTTWLNGYCPKSFTYTSYQKNKFDRAGYINGFIQQFQSTNKVLKSTLTIRSLDQKGATIVATIATDFKGIVTIDSRHLTLTDQGVTLETWTLVGKDWKLQKVVQVNADTQMQENEGALR